MYDCMLKLTVDMAEQGYWPSTEVEFMEAWIHDLAAIGYHPPSLTAHAPQQTGSQDTGPIDDSNHFIGSLDLFLPITSQFEAEFREQLLQSLLLFYP